MLENLRLSDEYDGFLFLAESVRNPPALRPHHHVELELNLVVSGSITYVVDGNRYQFPRYSLIWFYPAQEHQLVDRTDDAQYYVAVFKPRMIRDACRSDRYSLLKRTELSKSGVMHNQLDPVTFEDVCRSMEALVADGIDPDVLNREAGFGLSKGFRFQHNDPDWLNAGLRHLLLSCARHQSGVRARRGALKLHPAVQQALEELNKPGSLDSLSNLARGCGLSPSHLSRLFHKQVGVSLTRYRNSVRLGRFWEVYRKPGTQTALEAVYAAGFGSYAQFYRVFTQAYGKSPRNLNV